LPDRFGRDGDTRRDVVKRALVCGAGGFIGSHLVKHLKERDRWVRGVDLKQPEWSESAADEFLQLDLRDPESCQQALRIEGAGFDEVYQLAADMGGMGFIHSAECEIMRNSALINLHMTDSAAQARRHRRRSAARWPRQTTAK
jgi:nucleoside-diphosphate-sugar epimerase